MHRLAAAILFFFASTLIVHAQTAPKPLARFGAASVAVKRKQVARAPAMQTRAIPCGVGVMSAVGDTFTLRKVGIMVFGNEDSKVPLGTWGIDEFIYGKIAAALGSRRNVKRLVYSKAALSAYQNARMNVFRNSDGELREFLQGADAKEGCRRLITVMEASTQLANSNQSISGLGILEARSLFQKRLNLYAVMSIAVYDGRTFGSVDDKLVSEERGINKLLSMKGIRGLSREVDPSWWPDPARVNSDARLRDAMRDLIGRGLDVTVPDLIADAQL